MIFPRPQKEVYFDGTYTLKSYSDDFELINLYNKYKSGNEDVLIIKNIAFSEDKYILVIDENGIKITSSCDCGIFRAVSSLRQLIHEHGEKIPF